MTARPVPIEAAGDPGRGGLRGLDGLADSRVRLWARQRRGRQRLRQLLTAGTRAMAWTTRLLGAFLLGGAVQLALLQPAAAQVVAMVNGEPITEIISIGLAGRSAPPDAAWIASATSMPLTTSPKMA